MPTKMDGLYPVDNDSADRLRAMFRDMEPVMARRDIRRIRDAMRPFAVAADRLTGLNDNALVMVSANAGQLLRALGEALAALDALDELEKING